jgi:hypothetical protein
MKSQFRMLGIGVLLVLPVSASPPQVPSRGCSPCEALDQPLKDYQHIRVGIRRSEVDKYFQQDGGMQSPSTTRYVYPKCRYLHVDVKFEISGKDEKPFSPNDSVLEISKLYVDYAVKD